MNVPVLWSSLRSFHWTRSTGWCSHSWWKFEWITTMWSVDAILSYREMIMFMILIHSHWCVYMSNCTRHVNSHKVMIMLLSWWKMLVSWWKMRVSQYKMVDGTDSLRQDKPYFPNSDGSIRLFVVCPMWASLRSGCIGWPDVQRTRCASIWSVD